MERSPDIRKKYPLLVVGNLPFPGIDAEPLPRLAGADWKTYFVCISGTGEEIRERLHEAHALRVPPEQLLLFSPETTLPFAPPAQIARFERQPEECTEDLRHRLTQQFETMRQLRLGHELDRLEKLGVFDGLTPAAAAAAHDHARFAHALACVYGLNPEQHALTLRLAASFGTPGLHGRMFPGAEYPFAAAPAWSTGLATELILAHASALARAHGATPGKFREHFRGASAQLPFKSRNELKAHLEKILEPLWGGKHAA